MDWNSDGDYLCSCTRSPFRCFRTCQKKRPCGPPAMSAPSGVSRKRFLYGLQDEGRVFRINVNSLDRYIFYEVLNTSLRLSSRRFRAVVEQCSLLDRRYKNNERVMREIAAWRYLRPGASERNTITWNRLSQPEPPTPHHPRLCRCTRFPTHCRTSS